VNEAGPLIGEVAIKSFLDGQYTLSLVSFGLILVVR